MPNYEYKVVPAPKKGLKAKGLKTTDARFANAMMVEMNEMGADGWEYQRTDTLPCEERTGLRGRNTTYLNMLVFRREIATEVEAAEFQVEETATTATPAVATATTATAADAPQTHAPLLNGNTDSGRGAAPALGPATDAVSDAVEVKDPRFDTRA